MGESFSRRSRRVRNQSVGGEAGAETTGGSMSSGSTEKLPALSVWPGVVSISARRV